MEEDYLDFSLMGLVAMADCLLGAVYCFVHDMWSDAVFFFLMSLVCLAIKTLADHAASKPH